MGEGGSPQKGMIQLKVPVLGKLQVTCKVTLVGSSPFERCYINAYLFKGFLYTRMQIYPGQMDPPLIEPRATEPSYTK